MNHINIFKNNLITQEKVNAIMSCNLVSERHGLVLTEEEVKELLNTQVVVLEEVGRMEFTNTIIEQIITMFCDSQFINKGEYTAILNELVEIFYYYREATDEILSDEEIIKYMYASFEGPCQGSLSWLGDNQLNTLMNALADNKDIFEELTYGNY